jgi:hypothetical protein
VSRLILSVLGCTLVTRSTKPSHVPLIFGQLSDTLISDNRIQAQLYLQLGGFTANRPQALLSLCYRHIQVTLLRDPEGGPHRVLLEFTFEFTKEFLGIKDL